MKLGTRKGAKRGDAESAEFRREIESNAKAIVLLCVALRPLRLYVNPRELRVEPVVSGFMV